jgi:hypothetical protein
MAGSKPAILILTDISLNVVGHRSSGRPSTAIGYFDTLYRWITSSGGRLTRNRRWVLARYGAINRELQYAAGKVRPCALALLAWFSHHASRHV